MWEELEQRTNGLTEWFRKNFLSQTYPIEGVQDAYSEIVSFVSNSKHFRWKARNEFLNCADPWLIAFAYKYKLTVVTEERHDPKARRKVLIPVICEHFNIQWCNTIGMLSHFGIKI